MAVRTAVPKSPLPASRVRLLDGRGSALGDRAFRGVAFVFAAAILVLLATIFVVLFIDARVALFKEGLRFITGQVWNPTDEVFGALPYIYGTIFTSMIGLLIATPIAVGASLYIVEYAPSWLRTPVSFVVELLAVIPSVIYGFWGLAVLAPFLRDRVERPLKTAFGEVPGLSALDAVATCTDAACATSRRVGARMGATRAL